METNPYAAPAAPINVASSPAAQVRGFRSATRIARTIAWVMGLLSVGETARIINGARALVAIRRAIADGTASQAFVDAIKVRNALLGTSVALPYIALWVLWSLFMARANRNARALGAVTLKYSPRWAAGIFFVPIVNLYAPYRAMSEIWQASGAGIDSSDHTRTGGRRLLRWWWALYLAQNLVAWLLGLLTRGRHGADAAITKAATEIVTSSLSIPAAIAAALVVTGLARLQDQRQDGALAARASRERRGRGAWPIRWRRGR